MIIPILVLIILMNEYDEDKFLKKRWKNIMNKVKQKSLRTNIPIKFITTLLWVTFWWISSQYIRNYFNIWGIESEWFEILFIPILAIFSSAIIICFEIFWHKELYNHWAYVFIFSVLGFSIFDFLSETRIALLYSDLLGIFPLFIAIFLQIISLFIPLALLLLGYHFYLQSLSNQSK